MTVAESKRIRAIQAQLKSDQFKWHEVLVTLVVRVVTCFSMNAQDLQDRPNVNQLMNIIPELQELNENLALLKLRITGGKFLSPISLTD